MTSLVCTQDHTEEAENLVVVSCKFLHQDHHAKMRYAQSIWWSSQPLEVARDKRHLLTYLVIIKILMKHKIRD